MQEISDVPERKVVRALDDILFQSFKNKILSTGRAAFMH